MVFNFNSREEDSEELQKTQTSGYLEALEALVMAIDLRHADTQAHSRRVAKYSIRLAKEMGLDEKELSDLSSGVLLHDIGKIRIPDRILMKPAKLTDDERKKLERHPIYGYKIVKEIEFLSGANPIVLHHHERYDGSGYPKRLAKDKIPIGARILAVMDAYDAITSDRPYRKRSCYEAAKAELLKGSGTQFDPEVVAAFLRIPLSEWEEFRAEAEAEVASKTVINAKTFTSLLHPFLYSSLVVHELGNPLGVISSTLQYVRDTLSKSNTDNPQIVEALETVMDSIGQMHEILRRLTLNALNAPKKKLLTNLMICSKICSMEKVR